MIKTSVFLLGLSLFSQSNAATLAIIDSGVDSKHKDLIDNFIPELPGQNFADGDRPFDDSQITSFSPEIKRFVSDMARAMLGDITAEERTWAMDQIKVEGFIKEVQRFGNYVHGTHVAGIASHGTNHKLLSIKILPTPVKAIIEEVKTQASNEKAALLSDEEKALLLKQIIAITARGNGERMSAIGALISMYQTDVANGSFGVAMPQAVQFAKKAFQAAYGREGTGAEVDGAALEFLKALEEGNKKFVEASPKTLFVFASGNDANNNDERPCVPANVKADNSITVAATFDRYFFAPFSNYGVNHVDIAAPGMAIYSTIPGDEYVHLSGTSQAAPFVARVAGLVKDENPKLSALEIKQILLGTVDVKPFLKDKVASSGVVNKERAIKAAQFSMDFTVAESIEMATKEVGDTKNKFRPIGPLEVKPIPLVPLIGF